MWKRLWRGQADGWETRKEVTNLWDRKDKGEQEAKDKLGFSTLGSLDEWWWRITETEQMWGKDDEYRNKHVKSEGSIGYPGE